MWTMVAISSVGEYFYANFDCIMLDVALITIGRTLSLGPPAYMATHPLMLGSASLNLVTYHHRR